MAGWGVAYVPSAWLVEDVPPLLAAALRLSLAGGLLLAVMVGVQLLWMTVLGMEKVGTAIGLRKSPLS